MYTRAQSERDLWWAKECDRLQEQNEELKTEKAEMINHRELLEKYLKGCVADEEEENKKLKAEIQELKLTILSLKSSVVDLRESRDRQERVIEKLAETADDTPDQCEACDKRFDLHYTMNHCDKDLRKKYDDYFCSEEDDGDLCPECI